MSTAIVVFGRQLCDDTVRARDFLDTRSIPYEYLDIGVDEAARERAFELAQRANTPVILLGDGQVLVEPTDAELALATDGAERA